MQKAKVIAPICAGSNGSVKVDIVGTEVTVLKSFTCPDPMARMLLGVTDNHIIAVPEAALDKEGIKALKHEHVGIDLAHVRGDLVAPEGTLLALSDNLELELI